MNMIQSNTSQIVPKTTCNTCFHNLYLPFISSEIGYISLVLGYFLLPSVIRALLCLINLHFILHFLIPLILLPPIACSHFSARSILCFLFSVFFLPDHLCQFVIPSFTAFIFFRYLHFSCHV